MAQRISDYALLSDCQTGALAGRDGSIDWWCPPRFDAPSVFARLLDRDGGHWSIAPRARHTVERRYLPATMVLETTFRSEQGAVRLTDALAFDEDARGHDIGRQVPHAILRTLEGLSGSVAMDFELVPRMDYGRVAPSVDSSGEGLQLSGAGSRLTLIGAATLAGDPPSAAQLELRDGDRASFALTHRPEGDEQVAVDDPDRALRQTIAGWESWSQSHEYDGPYPAEVLRSALVLQALTYAPTGAIVAAPTTSLPEIVGADLNWDYRYAWLRDAALTMRALWVAACPHEASDYFAWMADAGQQEREGHVQIMFGVGGEREIEEESLDHLAGYRDSRPVRIGNEAFRQRQLDVPGEVLAAAHLLRDRFETIDANLAAFLRRLGDEAARSWHETDSGIWESRGPEQHYLSSKVMCWVALDRAVKLASRIDADGSRGEWIRERDAVRAAVLDRAWNERVGAFTAFFGSDELDASALLMPIFDFLPASDPRMRRTIEAIERELGEGGLVKRWTGAEDGAFVICSFWLAQCLAHGGMPGRAREVFEAVTAHANDVGLLSEEISLPDGDLIGNYPQAFSHVGLVNAAWSIAEAERRGDGAPSSDRA